MTKKVSKTAPAAKKPAAKKIEDHEIEQEEPATEQVEDLEEQVVEEEDESQPLAVDASEFNALVKKYTGKFWLTTVHITGMGTFQGGRATKKQLEAFIGNMNPATNLDEWLSDEDIYTVEVRKKLKKKPENLS